MKTTLLSAALLSMMVPALPATAQQAPGQGAQQAPSMTEILADERRVQDAPRDRHRHPAQTLRFFQVQPGMSVVDFMPSPGWYSRVLIPYLGPEGTYIGLNPRVAPDATGYMATLRDAATRLPQDAAGWMGGAPGARVIGANLGTIPAELDGTVDRVLIFREMHNVRRNDWTHQLLSTARRLLKADGMIGIVQHRAKADAPAAYTQGDNGYLRQKDVVALLDMYGFDLVAESEVNANPKDTADWEGGVWTLPPSYRGAGEDAARRAELDAIGESDRMTLLFRKRV